MPSMWLGLALGVLVSAFVVLVLAYARAGNLQRAWWGLTVAGRGAQNPDLEAKIHRLLGDPSAPVSMPTAPVPTPTLPPPPVAPPKPTGESLKLLRILQSEARLLDFLLELQRDKHFTVSFLLLNFLILIKVNMKTVLGNP